MPHFSPHQAVIKLIVQEVTQINKTLLKVPTAVEAGGSLGFWYCKIDEVGQTSQLQDLLFRAFHKY